MALFEEIAFKRFLSNTFLTEDCFRSESFRMVSIQRDSLRFLTKDRKAAPFERPAVERYGGRSNERKV